MKIKQSKIKILTSYKSHNYYCLNCHNDIPKIVRITINNQLDTFLCEKCFKKLFKYSRMTKKNLIKEHMNQIKKQLYEVDK